MEGGGFQQQITNIMGEAHLLGAALRGTESKTCINATNYTLCAEHVVSGIQTQIENVMDLLHCNKLQGYSNPCYPIDQHSI